MVIEYSLSRISIISSYINIDYFNSVNGDRHISPATNARGRKD